MTVSPELQTEPTPAVDVTESAQEHRSRFTRRSTTLLATAVTAASLFTVGCQAKGGPQTLTCDGVKIDGRTKNAASLSVGAEEPTSITVKVDKAGTTHNFGTFRAKEVTHRKKKHGKMVTETDEVIQILSSEDGKYHKFKSAKVEIGNKSVELEARTSLSTKLVVDCDRIS